MEWWINPPTLDDSSDLSAPKQSAYQLRPDFVMPYMSERVEVAEKALDLKEHGVSYDGIAYVLGKSEMHWYNLLQGLGRVSIVGATVKRAEVRPPI